MLKVTCKKVNLAPAVLICNGKPRIAVDTGVRGDDGDFSKEDFEKHPPIKVALLLGADGYWYIAVTHPEIAGAWQEKYNVQIDEELMNNEDVQRSIFAALAVSTLTVAK